MKPDRWFIVDDGLEAREFTPLRRELPFGFPDSYRPVGWCRVRYEEDDMLPIIEVPSGYFSRHTLDDVNRQLDQAG